VIQFLKNRLKHFFVDLNPTLQIQLRGMFHF